MRYWKGKAPKSAGELTSSDSEEDQRRVPEEENDIALDGEQNFLHARAASHEDTPEVKVILSGKEELVASEMEGAFSLYLSLPF